MGTRQDAIRQAGEWVQIGDFERDLAHLVSIQSESQNPANRGELLRYLQDGISPLMVRLGMEITQHENPNPAGGPFLTGLRHEGDHLPTVLIYGHGDVVHGQHGMWQDGLEPFKLVRQGDRLYGRGSADNKAQHLINLAALESVLKVRGDLGFNVKILLETSEETGSAGLEDFICAHKDILAADALIASDGPRLQPDKPTVFTGSRGAINFELAVRLREGAQHSGNWGGLLADPAMILAHALASITTARGGLNIARWRPNSLTPKLTELLKDLPVGGGGPEISNDWGEPGLSPAERVFGWNSFAVLAMQSGVPEAPQNAISGSARAMCQLRFVVGTDRAEILPALRQHLDRKGFEVVEIIAERGISAPATRLDPAHKWVRFAVTSIRRTTGNDPHVLPNLGGFIPNHVFSEILGLPTIWVPHSYAGCSQHAPNEHVLISIAQDATELMSGLFWDLGDAENHQNLIGSRRETMVQSR